MVEAGPNLSDEELAARYRSGSREALDLLMVRYKELVRRRAKALYLIGADTEDLIQEGMIGLFDAVSSYDPEREASFATFARLCIDRQLYSAVEASLRKKNRPLNEALSLNAVMESEEGEPRGEEYIGMMESAAGEDPAEEVIGREETERLLARIKETLSPFERSVFEKMMAGADYRTIAKESGKSPKSVDNAIQRIRAKIRRIMPERS
ncbi:MAG: sigma-70 family RNA polymerase sigma factor [Lachnospiraceae bacterium]|nr:sigma-70 family RNA polymerase sigma factor [Lachnospiraceae bacterium]